SLQDGTLTLTVVNPHATAPAEAAIRILGAGSFRIESARVLTAASIHAHNRFDEPAEVRPAEAKMAGEGSEFGCVFPARSVTLLRIRAA
ncbi:MAG TPA: alpha-L-arabinofuranosidase C-terminal domain-containing protein, partial [Planctomycetota bacterium]|nr:alpha-L-arabinofuranosidase C-terminal domain-containing protein [Planctomycetota bacterium]